MLFLYECEKCFNTCFYPGRSNYCIDCGEKYEYGKSHILTKDLSFLQKSNELLFIVINNLRIKYYYSF